VVGRGFRDVEGAVPYKDVRANKAINPNLSNRYRSTTTVARVLGSIST
jgi:hypothetical protein